MLCILLRCGMPDGMKCDRTRTAPCGAYLYAGLAKASHRLVKVPSTKQRMRRTAAKFGRDMMSNANVGRFFIDHGSTNGGNSITRRWNTQIEMLICLKGAGVWLGVKQEIACSREQCSQKMREVASNFVSLSVCLSVSQP